MSDTYADVKAIIVDLLGVKFGAEISDEDAQSITTVGGAVKYIDNHK